MESILNAMIAAETTVGYNGRTVHALPLKAIRLLAEDYRHPFLKSKPVQGAPWI